MLRFATMILMALVFHTFLYTELSDNVNTQAIKLKECLQEYWGIDKWTTAFLCKRFTPFLEDKNYHYLIDDFVNKSANLNIKFSIDKKLSCLSSNDGVIQATKYHIVVYETPYVRVLAGSANPGEREPFHTHSWKSILVIFEEADYYVEYPNGSEEFLSLQPGIYELPPENLYACTNIGKKRENGMVQKRPKMGNTLYRSSPPLCSLCLCVSKSFLKHRGTENTEGAMIGIKCYLYLNLAEKIVCGLKSRKSQVMTLLVI